MRKAKDSPKDEATWQKTSTQYLFKHGPSGTFYLRVRMGRRNATRESLKTDNYQVARARLSVRVAELRALRPPKKGWAPTTLWDALRLVEVQVKANPALKDRSKSAYADVIKSLTPGLPSGVPMVLLPKLTTGDVEAWWAGAAALHSPAWANYQLLFVRRALKLARKEGIMARALDANLRPVHIPRTRLKLITKEQFASLVETIAAFPFVGPPAAEWIEFAAYTGTRPEEANSVQWENIDRAAGIVEVTGNATGTKNREVRRVPILPALAGLLDRIAARTGATSGPVLTVKDPAKSIKQGCEAVGIPGLRRYDFRHLFATRCNEAGVDVPTFAKWLGHKDGGALAMKVYVHVHSEHEQRAAAKVVF